MPTAPPDDDGETRFRGKKNSRSNPPLQFPSDQYLTRDKQTFLRRRRQLKQTPTITNASSPHRWDVEIGRRVHVSASSYIGDTGRTERPLKRGGMGTMLDQDLQELVATDERTQQLRNAIRAEAQQTGASADAVLAQFDGRGPGWLRELGGSADRDRGPELPAENSGTYPPSSAGVSWRACAAVRTQRPRRCPRRASSSRSIRGEDWCTNEHFLSFDAPVSSTLRHPRVT